MRPGRNVFLDDLRDPWGPSWELVRTYDECIEALTSGPIDNVSLDHDIADEHYYGLGSEMTGYHVILWMVDNDVWPTRSIVIHTMNPVGRERMLQVAKRYAPENVRIDVRIRDWSDDDPLDDE